MPSHGMSDTPEHNAWLNMIQRCYNPKYTNYKLWGGKGVRVCVAWLESFEEFLKDVGPRPSSRHSIDRYPDKDGDYKPGNVRWANPVEQQRNRRNNLLITFQGETHALVEWAEILGISQYTLRQRLKVYGWSTTDAFTTSVGARPRKRKDVCKNGHEFNAANTRIVSTTGVRQCRACCSERQNKYRGSKCLS